MTESKSQDLELDLESFDPSRAAIATQDQEARGFAFSTLAEEQERRPADWLTKFTDLENATRAHIDAPRSPEQMIERLDFLKVVPEALFIVRRGNSYVGYTCLNVAESDAHTLIHGWTGVRPEHRRKGLATALKLRAAAYAKARGYRRIVTSPRRNNPASLGANAKVGYGSAPPNEEL